MRLIGLFLFLILQISSVSISSKEVSMIISADTTFIRNIDTTFVVELPILKDNYNPFLDEVVSTVLSYNVHEFKDCIYTIQIQEDSLKRGVVIYVSLEPSLVIESSQIKGVLRMQGTSFVYFGDNPNNLYSYTDQKQQLLCTKTIGYEKNGLFMKSHVPEIRESPIWKFVYRYGNKTLELYRVEFLPLENN